MWLLSPCSGPGWPRIKPRSSSMVSSVTLGKGCDPSAWLSSGKGRSSADGMACSEVIHTEAQPGRWESDSHCHFQGFSDLVPFRRGCSRPSGIQSLQARDPLGQAIGPGGGRGASREASEAPAEAEALLPQAGGQGSAPGLPPP